MKAMASFWLVGCVLAVFVLHVRSQDIESKPEACTYRFSVPQQDLDTSCSDYFDKELQELEQKVAQLQQDLLEAEKQRDAEQQVVQPTHSCTCEDKDTAIKLAWKDCQDVKNFVRHYIETGPSGVYEIHPPIRMHQMIGVYSSRECVESGDPIGLDYLGTKSTTESGKRCQAWNQQTPHKHQYYRDDDFPGDDPFLARNYCRNPDNEPMGPWCFTMNKRVRWEYCDIPICDDEPHHVFMNVDTVNMTVFCDLDAESVGWTVIMRRETFNTSFDRGWQDYKDGFGDVEDGDFWLGLENMHTLTSQGHYSLQITLEAGGMPHVHSYDTFKIGDADSGYKLTLKDGTTTGYSYQSLMNDGKVFGTKDRLPPAAGYNPTGYAQCTHKSKTKGGGWWFQVPNASYRCNSNLNAIKPYWAKLNDEITYVEMKIRQPS